MKTLKELNEIIDKNRDILIEDMFEACCYDNPNLDTYLYINVYTGETLITGCYDDYKDCLYVDYFVGFDIQEELIPYWSFVSEIDIVEKYNVKKEYEEAKEDLEKGQYMVGDFLCSCNILESVEDEFISQFFEEYSPAISKITEKQYSEFKNKNIGEIYED